MIIIKEIKKEGFKLVVRTDGTNYRVDKVWDCTNTWTPLGFCGEYLMGRLDAKYLIKLY
jgi:hypothetical protein